MTPSSTRVVINLDNGTQMSFSGYPFAGGTVYHGETVVRHRMYRTETGEHVYCLDATDAASRSLRAYHVILAGEKCTIEDGNTKMTMNLETLLLAVHMLAGDILKDRESSDFWEEILRSASC